MVGKEGKLLVVPKNFKWDISVLNIAILQAPISGRVDSWAKRVRLEAGTLVNIIVHHTWDRVQLMAALNILTNMRLRVVVIIPDIRDDREELAEFLRRDSHEVHVVHSVEEINNVIGGGASQAQGRREEDEKKEEATKEKEDEKKEEAIKEKEDAAKEEEDKKKKEDADKKEEERKRQERKRRARKIIEFRKALREEIDEVDGEIARKKAKKEAAAAKGCDSGGESTDDYSDVSDSPWDF